MDGRRRALFMAAAIAAAAPAAAETWRASSRTADAGAYIDADSIRRDGDRVRFTREVRWPQGRTFSNGVRYDRLRTLYVADCKANMLQSLGISARLGDKVIFTSEEPGKLEPVTPKTTADTDLRAACFGEWPAGR